MLNLAAIGKSYGPHAVLRDVSFDVTDGELCAIVGPSGSGKSTLMNLLGLLDRPTVGMLHFGGRDVGGLSPAQAAAMRNQLIGFVFQSFELLPRLTALQNVALPLMYRGVTKAHREAKAAQLLERVGLGNRRMSLSSELSGGQRQRVAIARALVGAPKLILADEPTGSLDSSTSDEVMELLLDLNQKSAVTTIIITHDNDVAARCPRQISILDGRVARDCRVAEA